MKRHCPRCGSERLQPVGPTAGTTNLLCAACRRCWAQEYGYLIEVNPLACPGCASRNVCRTA